jgi:hypothetical protein
MINRDMEAYDTVSKTSMKYGSSSLKMNKTTTGSHLGLHWQQSDCGRMEVNMASFFWWPVVMLLSLYTVTKLLFTMVHGNMPDLCDSKASKNVTRNTTVAPEQFITHVKHNAYFWHSNPARLSTHWKTTVSNQLLLVYNSNGLPSRSLNLIPEETTDEYKEKLVEVLCNERMAPFLSRFV